MFKFFLDVLLRCRFKFFFFLGVFEIRLIKFVIVLLLYKVEVEFLMIFICFKLRGGVCNNFSLFVVLVKMGNLFFNICVYLLFNFCMWIDVFLDVVEVCWVIIFVFLFSNI